MLHDNLLVKIELTATAVLQAMVIEPIVLNVVDDIATSPSWRYSRQSSAEIRTSGGMTMDKMTTKTILEIQNPLSCQTMDVIAIYAGVVMTLHTL